MEEEIKIISFDGQTLIIQQINGDIYTYELDDIEESSRDIVISFLELCEALNEKHK